MDHWIPDSKRNSCRYCHKPFTLWERKHHCRHCGDIFCQDHLRHWLYLDSQANFIMINELNHGGLNDGGTLCKICDDCLVEYENLSSSNHGANTNDTNNNNNNSGGDGDGDDDERKKVRNYYKNRQMNTLSNQEGKGPSSGTGPGTGASTSVCAAIGCPNTDNGIHDGCAAQPNSQCDQQRFAHECHGHSTDQHDITPGERLLDGRPEPRGTTRYVTVW